MNEKIKIWLQTAPMPDVELWLRSLYNDNILAVSRGGENVPAAFAEYGKKLMVDKILEIKKSLKVKAPEYFDVQAGSELLGSLRLEDSTED
jgi:hypothetical protein